MCARYYLSPPSPMRPPAPSFDKSYVPPVHTHNSDYSYVPSAPNPNNVMLLPLKVLLYCRGRDI